MAEAKAAIVTGGAQGIGKGIAMRLVADGWRVTIVDIESTARAQPSITGWKRPNS